ncbi:hypothetical protein ACHAWF_015609 [Thalassiosira exigua]
MSNSVASSRVGRNRKYNIAPEFLSSPYLSKPIGSFDYDKKRRSGSPKAKGSGRRRGDSDAESLGSFRTHRTTSSYRTQRTYQRPSKNSAQRMASIKNFLLPREMDKLLRGFRQKHSNHPITNGQSEEDYEDDNSTIASADAASLDDKAVYLHCRRDGEEVMKSIFSGPLFAELTWRNCDREKGPIKNDLTLPPVGSIDHDKSGEVSDLESAHSSASKLVESKHPVYARRKR